MRVICFFSAEISGKLLGLRFKVQGSQFQFKVQNSRFQVPGSRFKIQNLRFIIKEKRQRDKELKGLVEDSYSSFSLFPIPHSPFTNR